MLRQTFNQRVLPLFILSLVVATTGSVIGLQIPPILFIPVMIIEVIFFFLAAFFRRAGNINPIFLWVFIFLTGVTTAPLISYFLNGGLNGDIILAEAFGITSLIFIVLGGYTYITGRDFRGIGPTIFAMLLGLIVLSVVNLFLHATNLQIAVSSLAVVIFSGYILYDFSSILRDYSDDQVDLAVLSLYLDFLNLFINVLELLGIIQSRKD